MLRKFVLLGAVFCVLASFCAASAAESDDAPPSGGVLDKVLQENEKLRRENEKLKADAAKTPPARQEQNPATQGKKVVKQPPKGQQNTSGKTTAKKTTKMTAAQATDRLVKTVGLFGKASVSEVRTLLAAGANVNAREKYMLKDTALMLAAWHQSPEVLRVLLDAGADVNARNNEGYTALVYATKSNNPEMVKALLSAGADVNARDKSGYTVLMKAAEQNGTENPEVLRVLLTQGADVNARNEFTTALISAADRTTTEEAKEMKLHVAGMVPEVVLLSMVEILLAHGADVNARDSYGRTALDHAAGYKHKVAEALRAAGAK